MPRLVLVFAVLAIATVLGLWWRSRNGRFTPVERSVLDRAARLDPAGVPASSGASPSVASSPRTSSSHAGSPTTPGLSTTSGPAIAGHADAVVTPDRLGAPLGSTATFLQLSSEVCTPCRRTHAVLSTLAGERDGVVHVDLDVAEHLDLVRQFDVLRTPTVLLLDPAGVVVGRMSGATSRAQAIGALEHLRHPEENP